MIDDKGLTILGINLEARQVACETPDGQGVICDVVAWFAADGTRLNGPVLAETFAFMLNGVRYDGHLQGMSENATVIVDEAGRARESKASRLRRKHGPSRFLH